MRQSEKKESNYNTRSYIVSMVVHVMRHYSDITIGDIRRGSSMACYIGTFFTKRHVDSNVSNFTEVYNWKVTHMP